jgi:tRNA-dihydrouridine synthase A
MIDWTDRHCRYFHRRFTTRTLLYTEMITTGAILNGDRERLLAFHADEHPVALQLGGSEPGALARATGIGVGMGYDEINLNVGCPSDRVQSGCFGAALMREPGRVADCVAAMIDAAGPVPVTVKCRIGVDGQEPAEALPRFLAAVAAAGCRTFIVHARKAWLQGLSPKENREVPPLDYPLVTAMRLRFPDLSFVINGGVPDLDAAAAHLAAGFDGVMIGRAAYSAPAILGAADRRVFGAAGPDTGGEDAVRAMLPYIEAELGRGTRLHQITRHMLGAFQGRPGARAWRRDLSEGARRPGAGPDLVAAALSRVAAAAAPGDFATEYA